jgi:photosystem II stability/assembly factor-like uncharacterized protein
MPRWFPLKLKSEAQSPGGCGKTRRVGFLGAAGSMNWVIGGAILLAGFTGCRARVPAVSADAVDEKPPYSFQNLSSPLDSVAFAADDLHGWAVGTGGTILRTSDGGKNWQRTDNIRVKAELHSVCVSSDGTRAVAVGDFGNVLRTDDGGKSWAGIPVAGIGATLHTVDLSANGRNGWIVGDYGIILRSVDGGLTWQKSENANTQNLQAVTFSSDDLHGWAVGDDGAMLLSTDGGLEWQSASGIPKSEYLQGVTFLSDGRHGWTVGDYGAVYQSADGGRNWLKVPNIPSEGYLNSIVFATDGQHGWIGGDYGVLLRTLDGGQTWKGVYVPTGEDIYTVAFSGDGKRGWAVGDTGALLITGDGGEAWSEAGGPVDEVGLRSITFAADALHGWAAGDGGLILRSSDGGQKWQETENLPTHAGLKSVAFSADGKHGWAVGENSTLLRSADGGQSWQKTGDTPGGPKLYSVAFAADALRGWAVGEKGTILNTADGGQTWQRHPGVPTPLELDSVAVTSDGMRGWATGQGGTVLRTTNGGQSWEKVQGILTPVALRSVAFAPDGLHGWASGDSGTVLRTADGGLAWETVMAGSPIILSGAVAFADDGRNGWLVGDNGNIMRSADGGAFWWWVSHDAKQGMISSVAVSHDGLHAWASGDRGTLMRTSSSVVDSRPFEGKLSVRLELGGGTVRPVLSVEDRKLPSIGMLYGHLDLSGPRASGDMAKAFTRYFVFGQAYEGWKTADLGPGVYTCHVEVFDGWNVVSQDIQFGSGPWQRIVGFMGWDIVATQPLEFLKAHGTQNLVLLLVLYCLAIIGLFAFAPSWFVLWHEKAAPLIAALPIPSKATDKVTQLAGLFLIGRARALDAVVAEFAPLALAELERIPEVAARPKWVAAPLQVEDEVFGQTASPFAESAAAAEGELYVRGLTELKRHLVQRRWWLSIEGPGGVGKSALAFQIARWFAAPEPQSRLHITQAIPISIRSLKEGLDAEVLAELKRILDLPRMSPQLSGALLSRRRVLALIDGISEKASDIEALEIGPLNPSKGAALTHLVVMTSRRRIQIPDVVKVLPKAVDLGSIDEVLSRYLDDVVGAGRFSPSQREAIRESLKGIMKEISSESGQPPQIPMVFVKLIIQRADEVLSKDEAPGASGSPEASLPKDLSELVDAYVASLLEARPEGVAEANQARRAALACIGQDGLPKLRPLAAYEARSLTLAQLEGLVVTGLMVKDAADVGDPRYKFALDPIAEYLAAKELVISVRDGRMTPAQLKGDCSQFVAVSDVAAKVALIARALGVAVG